MSNDERAFAEQITRCSVAMAAQRLRELLGLADGVTADIGSRELFDDELAALLDEVERRLLRWKEILPLENSSNHLNSVVNANAEECNALECRDGRGRRAELAFRTLELNSSDEEVEKENGDIELSRVFDNLHLATTNKQAANHIQSLSAICASATPSSLAMDSSNPLDQGNPLLASLKAFSPPSGWQTPQPFTLIETSVTSTGKVSPLLDRKQTPEQKIPSHIETNEEAYSNDNNNSDKEDDIFDQRKNRAMRLLKTRLHISDDEDASNENSSTSIPSDSEKAQDVCSPRVIVISDSEDDYEENSESSSFSDSSDNNQLAPKQEPDGALLIFPGNTRKTRLLKEFSTPTVSSNITKLDGQKTPDSTCSFQFLSDESFNTPVTKYTPLITRFISRTGAKPSPIDFGKDTVYTPDHTKNVKPLQRAKTIGTNISKRISNKILNPSVNAQKLQFRKVREQMACELFAEFNNVVFGKQLPVDMPLTWTERLQTTAGRTYSRRKTSSSGEVTYSCAIELGAKVLDCEEKLRSTLMHEMCHAAAWLINHTNKPPHGNAFNAWGQKAEDVFPDIKVSTCHSYEIDYKHKWECTNVTCRAVIGRHSKTIDVKRSGCGSCGSILKYIERLKKDGTPMKPRQASQYQIFIKQNYNKTKQEQSIAAHKDVMSALSLKWAQMKVADVDLETTNDSTV